MPTLTASFLCRVWLIFLRGLLYFEGKWRVDLSERVGGGRLGGVEEGDLLYVRIN